MDRDDVLARRRDPLAAERAVADDLKKLGEWSQRDLPTLDETARNLAPAIPGPIWGGWIMKTLREPRRRRSVLGASLAAATAAALAFFVPVPYEQLTGHDVTLAVAAPNLDPALLEVMASRVKTALRADEVTLAIGGEGEARMVARVPDRARPQVEAIAQALAQIYASEGLHAQVVSVVPHRERVLGSVVALASDFLEINITREGRSGEEIAADIRSQLVAAGFDNPEVEVENTDDTFKVKVQCIRRGDESAPEAPLPELRMRVDGQGEPADANKVQVRVERRAGMTDDEVIADVRRQLAEQGIEADVTIENGRVRIERERPR